MHTGAGFGSEDGRDRHLDAPSVRQVWLELLLIGLFTAVYLLAFRDRPRYLDGVLGLAAVVLIGAAYGRTRRLWRAQPAPAEPYRRRFEATAIRAGAFTLAGALLFFAVGAGLGYEHGGWQGAAARVLNPHYLPAVGLYLLWGLAQQFVFEVYLLGRLSYILPPRAAVALMALIFSAVHYPRFVVMAAVFVAALVWGSLYRRYRVLLPLAASHAILGASLHYWIFGRDLLAQWLLR